ncbi:hypothetical protein KY359_00035 [Candidatus Woesearchaeota archaeon]|nr:hypothetical protein [Candidatus Woesearchaeota archaeon]
MAFFFSSNPIALFLALVLVVVVLKIWLGKHKWFSGGNSAYITLLLIILIILLISYRPLLEVVAIGVPYFIMVVMFLVALAGLLLMLGMQKGTIWPAMKQVGPLKVAVQIFIVCCIAFAGSQVFGEKLLKEPSVSIADPMMPEQEKTEIDFAPLFTQQALGIIFIIVILGLAFVFVNLAA